ncbi:MAG: hypothetical protein SGILL_006071 [Bacillariaceae sp.]
MAAKRIKNGNKNSNNDGDVVVAPQQAEGRYPLPNMEDLVSIEDRSNKIMLKNIQQGNLNKNECRILATVFHFQVNKHQEGGMHRDHLEMVIMLLQHFFDSNDDMIEQTA